MATYSQPPPELATAINNAARRYSIPPDLLVGIWRREAGSAYPNPYVNPSGYGGLFGTRLWNGTTQAQADLAASILAEGLRQSGGNIAGALSYYNSGKTSGGYTSVPGETTYGRVRVPGATPTPPSTVTTTGYTRPGPQNVSFAGDLYDAAKALGNPGGFLGGLLHSGPLGSISDLADLFKLGLWLMLPKTWLRVVEFMFGTVLMLLSLAALAVGFLSKSPAGRAGLGFLGLRGLTRRRRRRPSTAGTDELAHRRARTEAERTKEVRARRRRHLEEARDRRREREKRERAAYYRGAADASR